MSRVFLCHCSEDKKFVETLANDLMKFGIEVWFDKFEMKVGESLLEKINEGIMGSGYFAVVLSPRSVDKSWVKHEIQSAFAKKFMNQDFKILPILYESCDMPLYLAGLLYADFIQSYDHGFKDILNVFGLRDVDVCTKSNWRAVHKSNKQNKDWKRFKDEEYKELVSSIFSFCYQHRWGIFIGGHSNPYAITFTAVYQPKEHSYHMEYINIRLCSDDVYKLSFKKEYNPNHLKAKDYTEEAGISLHHVREKLMDMMIKANETYGMPKQERGMYVLSRMQTEDEKARLIGLIVNDRYVFDGSFSEAISKLHEEDNSDLPVSALYI